MYSYTWDEETGGLLLNSSPLKFSKEPRPVYYKELDLLGLDKYWDYEKIDDFPYMWAESNFYYYRGRLVAKTNGGSLYSAPTVELKEEPEPNGKALKPVDLDGMVEKNRKLMEEIASDTIKRIYNTYRQYRNKIDLFYVAFSGGKDSVVALDLVQRALPHNSFKVLFGNTGMELGDTLEVVRRTKDQCLLRGIGFLESKSSFLPEETWKLFGPPSVTNRWCCSIHKTAPQILLLRQYQKNNSFRGLAFTGIRADESLSRSKYEDINIGNKHKGQYSYHPILEWNTAEIFDYIYQEGLILNRAYAEGIPRVGCILCPMSSSRNDYFKAQNCGGEINRFTRIIEDTSGKINFTKEEMLDFIDLGNWKRRKTGKELNFGIDKHLVENLKDKTKITVYDNVDRWKEWVKTIGTIDQIESNRYNVKFGDKVFGINVEKSNDKTVFIIPYLESNIILIKFISLFKSVIIKSLYCVNCGECEANCPNGCIDMTQGQGLTISSERCSHCYQCHDIHEHCLRYNSIRYRSDKEMKTKGLDRYFSFGIRKKWIDVFFREKGSANFWETDGNGFVPNKKKEAFLHFVQDAGLVKFEKTVEGDRFVKNIPTQFAYKVFSLGVDSDDTWALMLVNLSYTPEFNWFVKNIPFNVKMTLEQIKIALNDVMASDIKGLGKRNVVDAFKILIIKTPFGGNLGLGIADYEEKFNSSGSEIVSLKSFYRKPLTNINSLVVLYSLYKFAEACGDYYQFSLNRLLDHDVESAGISPTQIFGLDRDTMEKLLVGLSINYPDFIATRFTLDLDTIKLNENKSSSEVVELF